MPVTQSIFVPSNQLVCRTPDSWHSVFAYEFLYIDGMSPHGHMAATDGSEILFYRLHISVALAQTMSGPAQMVR